MTMDDILYLGQNAMFITLLASAPMLLSGLVVGLTISIFQSVTQIQEMTLTFVPKIVVVLVVFVLFMPFMAETVLGFMDEIFAAIGDFEIR